jgi:hypothetical protein
LENVFYITNARHYSLLYLELTMIESSPLPPIATLDKMAELVQMSKGSLSGVWQTWPHFYVGSGRNAKGARFIPADVIAFLYENGGLSVRSSVSNKEGTAVQSNSISGRKSSNKQARVSHQKRGAKVASGRSQKTYYENPDRHKLRLCG